MADGDDRLLGPPTTDQVLETALKLTGSSYCGSGDLAEEGADIAVARCGIAPAAFASGLVVAGTDPRPFAQPSRVAKRGHVHPDFNQEFRRGQPINAGHGHQQLQGRLMGLERLHQIAFEVSPLRLQSPEVMTKGLGDEAMIRAQFALERR